MRAEVAGGFHRPWRAELPAYAGVLVVAALAWVATLTWLAPMGAGPGTMGLSLVAFLPNVLMVDPNLGVNSVADLVALLKKDPAKRTFASSGPGTSTHLAGEMLGDILGIKLTHIAYKGTPPAMLDSTRA